MIQVFRILHARGMFGLAGRADGVYVMPNCEISPQLQFLCHIGHHFLARMQRVMPI